ncbi:hypothetical protein KAX35_01630 [candidate division WOR-3 bacterium]|nr:hypothetical protein [candidate division WOR-3 bacterium]
MKKIFILVIITFTNVFADPYNYQWKTLRPEVEKEHKLDIFELPQLEKNIEKFLGKDEVQKYKLYAVDELRKRALCNTGLFTVMGFYTDSLIFYFLSTDELPYIEEGPFEDPIGECLSKEILPNDTLMYYVDFKLEDEDGNIFWEGGFRGVLEHANKYIVEVISFGFRGISNPQHLQYTYFFFDKSFLDNVTYNMIKIHPENREKIHPVALFTDYLVNEYEKLQKPIE